MTVKGVAFSRHSMADKKQFSRLMFSQAVQS